MHNFIYAYIHIFVVHVFFGRAGFPPPAAPPCHRRSPPTRPDRRASQGPSGQKSDAKKLPGKVLGSLERGSSKRGPLEEIQGHVRASKDTCSGRGPPARQVTELEQETRFGRASLPLRL